MMIVNETNKDKKAVTERGEKGEPGRHAKKPRRVLKRRFRKRSRSDRGMGLAVWAISKLDSPDEELAAAALAWLCSNRPSMTNRAKV